MNKPHPWGDRGLTKKEVQKRNKERGQRSICKKCQKKVPAHSNTMERYGICPRCFYDWLYGR